MRFGDITVTARHQDIAAWFATDNASITTWEQRPWRNQPHVWTLLRYNDTSHLDNQHKPA